jgi:hypothetical protein
MGVQLGFMGVQLGGKVIWAGLRGLRLRRGDWRAATEGCHRASLMMRRRAAAAAVRPCLRPGPGSSPSSFPQVTCPDRSGRPVLTPLFACGMRGRQALAVLAWSGDGSPVRGCTTTSGDRVPIGHLFELRLSTGRCEPHSTMGGLTSLCSNCRPTDTSCTPWPLTADPTADPALAGLPTDRSWPESAGSSAGPFDGPLRALAEAHGRMICLH